MAPAKISNKNTMEVTKDKTNGGGNINKVSKQDKKRTKGEEESKANWWWMGEANKDVREGSRRRRMAGA